MSVCMYRCKNKKRPPHPDDDNTLLSGETRWNNSNTSGSCGEEDKQRSTCLKVLGEQKITKVLHLVYYLETCSGHVSN